MRLIQERVLDFDAHLRLVGLGELIVSRGLVMSEVQKWSRKSEQHYKWKLWV